MIALAGKTIPGLQELKKYDVWPKSPMQTDIQDLAEQSGCLGSDVLIAKVNVAETAASTSASRNKRSERWESSV